MVCYQSVGSSCFPDPAALENLMLSELSLDYLLALAVNASYIQECR